METTILKMCSYANATVYRVARARGVGVLWENQDWWMCCCASNTQVIECFDKNFSTIIWLCRASNIAFSRCKILYMLERKIELWFLKIFHIFNWNSIHKLILVVSFVFAFVTNFPMILYESYIQTGVQLLEILLFQRGKKPMVLPFSWFYFKIGTFQGLLYPFKRRMIWVVLSFDWIM